MLMREKERKMMDSVEHFRWICNVPIGLTICALGIIGNIISIVVWRRVVRNGRRGSNSASTYLITLGVCDIGFLVFFILTETIPSARVSVKSTYEYAVFYSWVGYPVTQTFFIAGVWLVVGVTINRFILIQFPIRGKELCSNVRTRASILLILLLAVAVNIPHFFNYHPKLANGGYKLKATTYGASIHSRRFHFWCHCILLSVFPWFIIAVLNCLIIRKMRKQTKKFTSIRSRSKSADKDNQMTTMLLFITFTFILLLGFQCITQCFHKQQYHIFDIEVWITVKKFYTLGRLALAINSSINCIFYCFNGLVFRNEVKRLLKTRRISTYISRSTTKTTMRSLASVITRNQGLGKDRTTSGSTVSIITSEVSVTTNEMSIISDNSVVEREKSDNSTV